MVRPMLDLLLLVLVTSARGLNVVDVGASTASKLLPFENKDSYFSSPPSFYGVFDGVSQCPESRAYSQTLAKTCSAVLSSQSTTTDWNIQAQSALREATSAAGGYSGSSTAILMRVDLDGDEPRLSTFCLGDCQILVLRSSEDNPGSLVVADYSSVKFHENGAPYQLGGKGWQSDVIEDGEFEDFALFAGDTVLCFSDGFANNFDLDEVAVAVADCATLSAGDMAAKLVAEARRCTWCT
jgi:hypothetical protein